ncbi:SAM-dependent methyltransferase [Amycolatopsis bartoniae]|uniref:Methyltransferase n=1 Tax=Amycolatopsis bartoniae TaxID=941986 RepID=A0A8H9MDG3_9PSEU|nr:class I SAM-dependent methyltransferase [Amycolatopsis bartoniae]MBB2938603.1 SAM-dependent methyltransferase [Amycolatopsis bartoniae]TVT08897.1 class I SAM-dependent methyltransferase [Amycolatopsis bartoniae]GHF69819.1 methyltransferase [Amycolatopsis bartoniae]
MAEKAQKFDGLSGDYDRFRPRYPEALLRRLAAMVPRKDEPQVADIGAGTGIALEGLVPLLGEHCRYTAVDVSADMVAAGRRKFPAVEWLVGGAEEFLESATGVDLVVAAQSFQWLDRPRVLRAATACLAPGGVFAVIQNNRDYRASAFLDSYESLLEELSPGYSRHYRDFDFATELRQAFEPVGGTTATDTADWTMTMRAEDFEGMAKSSTQVQRGLAAHGDELLARLRELCEKHAEDGRLSIPYHTELFTARAPGDAARG